MLLVTCVILNRNGVIIAVLKKDWGNVKYQAGNIMGLLSIFWTVAIAVAEFVSYFLTYLTSTSRKDKYKKERQEYYEEMFIESDKN